MNCLDQLAAHARERVEIAKASRPLSSVRQDAQALPKGDFQFEHALSGQKLAFICECKRASPSKGLIAPEFRYLDIAKEYEKEGAEAISILTEPKWFLGNDRYLQEIAETVTIPCLRKDFVVDEYMLYEAKLLGASAVLLICAILEEEQVRDYIGICDAMGISALVETHNEAETEMALRAGARIVGVNNRNLKDFTVDISNSEHLRAMVPDDVLFVSESGIKDAGDVESARVIGADAVLIGEALMRAKNLRAKFAELRGMPAEEGVARLEAVPPLPVERLETSIARFSGRRAYHGKARPGYERASSICAGSIR